MDQKYDVRISKNFTLREFIISEVAQKNWVHQQYDVPLTILRNICDLVSHTLQPLRDYVGIINISSGYRCPELNKLVGGSASSQHMKGQAVDVICSNTTHIIEALNYLPFDQFIIYDSFFHISYDRERTRRDIIIK